MPCPAELSWLPQMADKNKSSRTQSVVPVGKGVVIPSTGECLEPFSETSFIGNGMCTGI